MIFRISMIFFFFSFILRLTIFFQNNIYIMQLNYISYRISYRDVFDQKNFFEKKVFNNRYYHIRVVIFLFFSRQILILYLSFDIFCHHIFFFHAYIIIKKENFKEKTRKKTKKINMRVLCLLISTIIKLLSFVF